jgi:hypothetical protein
MANAIVRSVVTLYKERRVPGCLTDVGAEGFVERRLQAAGERLHVLTRRALMEAERLDLGAGADRRARRQRSNRR